MKPGRLGGLAAIAAVLVLGMWLLAPGDRPMPPVTFTLTDGSRLHSDALRGKDLLINFWSVTCEVCLRDMPRLEALHDSLADEGFSVIGVAMSYDPPPAVMATVDRLEPGYPIALDTRGEIGEAFGDVRATPTNILVDAQGNIRYRATGPLDTSRIRATLLTF